MVIRLFIVGAQKIYAHNFKDKTFQQIESFSSYENPKGIFALNSFDKTVIAFPDKTKGSVRIKLFETESTLAFNFAFSCCESIVASIKFNHEGSLLATASEKVK